MPILSCLKSNAVFVSKHNNISSCTILVWLFRYCCWVFSFCYGGTTRSRFHHVMSGGRDALRQTKKKQRKKSCVWRHGVLVFRSCRDSSVCQWAYLGEFCMCICQSGSTWAPAGSLNGPTKNQRNSRKSCSSVFLLVFFLSFSLSLSLVGTLHDISVLMSCSQKKIWFIFWKQLYRMLWLRCVLEW